MSKRYRILMMFSVMLILCLTSNTGLAKENINYGKKLTEYDYFEEVYALDEEILKEVKDIYLLEHPEGAEQALAEMVNTAMRERVLIYMNLCLM